ncbi:chitotriosidase-1 [Scaptodrosophila lebanonensis]|uniref:Chitotriosidase-1 n=1 Tax=Drosophila lebanonensis TaxID=7225 RepID=A0A6J2TZK8_DROLE|nr:chitotriosidase-1 [Scaptodrosophila lebanonensis]
MGLCLCFFYLSFGTITRNLVIERPQRLVCYYQDDGLELRLLDVPGDLCTHINIGVASLNNLTLALPPSLQKVLQDELPIYHAANPHVKILLWIGGADSGKEFADMVINHARRKEFIRSLKAVMQKYRALDGIDLDWEFPSAYDKERQHFSQLLYEIRQEWNREHRSDRVLSVAVAAPEGIAFFAYNIRELNLYADYVSVMAYDFHFYTKDTPFTGLNAPLYARKNESSIMSTFNINYTIHWWLRNGIEPNRLVVGLPTYGHSFTLVNPFNKRIGAPALGVGECGLGGFTTHSQTCDCGNRYLKPLYEYDEETCSPILSANQEWISYENEKSITCKAQFAKSLNIGGVMIYSLNSDDIKNSCSYIPKTHDNKPVFPLTQAVKAVISQ